VQHQFITAWPHLGLNPHHPPSALGAGSHSATNLVKLHLPARVHIHLQPSSGSNTSPPLLACRSDPLPKLPSVHLGISFLAQEAPSYAQPSLNLAQLIRPRSTCADPIQPNFGMIQLLHMICYGPMDPLLLYHPPA
jgi:hypothetical protein